MRVWLAAVIAAVLLLAGGLGGYFIGAAGDHHRDGRPGVHRMDADRDGPPRHEQRGGGRGDRPGPPPGRG